MLNFFDDSIDPTWTEIAESEGFECDQTPVDWMCRAAVFILSAAAAHASGVELDKRELVKTMNIMAAKIPPELLIVTTINTLLVVKQVDEINSLEDLFNASPDDEGENESV